MNKIVTATKEIQDYYKNLEEKIDLAVSVGKKARATRKDVCDEIESLPAAGIAEKTEVIIGPPGVAKVYNELWEKYKDREKVILDIVDKILDKSLGGIEEPEKRLNQALRTALVMLTEGVVVSPLDGMPEIKISTNPDGTKYPDIYFAGPIRAAGGTGQTWPLLLADYARQKLNLDVYKPSKKEVDRIIEEVNIYQDEIVARQLRMNDKEIKIVAENCPICINSGPDSEVEVIANRDLDRIPTNRIRGAMCLVLIDGVFVRKLKILKISKKLGLNWAWLEKLIKVKKTSEGTFELKPISKYIEGLAAGRPVFSHPSRVGGFRLRYGKPRNAGLMAKAINPATMYVLESFVAVGTHGKIERPGKSLQFFPCDTIDGPIVRLKNKQVIQLNTVEEAKKYLNDIERILFVGDVLITVGDFRKSGHPLIPSGYVEEEWFSEMEYLLKNNTIDKEIFEHCKRLYDISDPYIAVALSMKYNIPLFPEYIWHYNLIDFDELKQLIASVRDSEKIYEENHIIGFKINFTKDIKEILEKIGIPHTVNKIENTINFEKNESYPFLKATGALNAINPLEEFIGLEEFKDLKIVDILSKISKIKIKDKSGTFIGIRMGRPEAAHERTMAGKPHVLFPLGHGFGNNRDLIRASMKQSSKASAGEYGISQVDVKAYQCPDCKKILFSKFCFDCNKETKTLRICPKCKKQTYDEICPVCNSETKLKLDHKINLDKLIDTACKNLKVSPPESLKAVKGLVSTEKVSEALEKGILRSKHNVYVFRDGTSRYEALNATISQFSGKELNLSVEKLKELGYKVDYLGNELKDENQRLDIFPQDIIVDEGCGEYFLRVSHFLDDLLTKFYGVPKYFNAKTKEDLIGELVIGLAPHTSAGIVGRILGYSKSRLCWGHPYYITAKRRNVDGDQDSMLLLMDSLLNFSQSYLSKGRGGRMDAPLAFTTVMSPFEIDDEAHEMETCTKYPYEFYQATKIYGDAKLKNIEFVDNVLGTPRQYNCVKFTHDTNKFDEGPKTSSYLTIKNMSDKVIRQAELQKRIKAVDNKDALERLLHYHLFPDIIGNTRAFARQKLRCIKCNAKYRRMPLSGQCTCGGRLILTIAEGSIKKYVNIAKDIIRDYELKPYLYQRVKLCEEEINSLFSDKEEKKQKSLAQFF